MVKKLVSVVSFYLAMHAIAMVFNTPFNTLDTNNQFRDNSNKHTHTQVRLTDTIKNNVMGRMGRMGRISLIFLLILSIVHIKSF